MNMNVLDATEHGGIAEHRSHRCNWLIALACVWMTLPLLAWPITIDYIDPASAPPGTDVVLRGNGFSEPFENYVVIVAGASPTAAVELDVVSKVESGNSQVLGLRVGEAEEFFQGSLVVLEGDEIDIPPAVFTIDGRVFIVESSRFSARACQHAGGFEIEEPVEEAGGGPTWSHGSGSGSHSTQPAATIWAQPMGPSLELLLWLDPIDPIHTAISHMIDPEDCGDDGAKDVILPGEIQMTYLSGQPSSQEVYAEDLTIALQYAFADYEGVSVHSAGPWVTVELGREVDGDSILVQVFSTDPPD